MYPSFVTCLLLLGLACVPFTLDCLESLQINRSWLLLCTVSYLLSLFLHFTQPENQLYWMTVCLFAAFYVVQRAKSRPWPVLQALLIGVTVQVVAEWISVLYPYTAWHHVPVYLLFASLWCGVAWMFSEHRSQCVTFVASICLVGMLREWCVSGSVAMAHVGQKMCNQYWIAFVLVMLVDWLRRLLVGLRLGKHPII